MIIENLVFEGGGVKGIAYAGAIAALESNHLLKNVQRVAGTSAGAITAALVALNFDAATITEIVNGTDFKKFEDHWNPLKIPSKYGLYKGEFLLEFIESLLAKKELDKSTTFKDLQAKNFKDLKLFASDLNLKTAKEFSVTETPDAIVAEAVRASMSIPLFFRAWTFSNGIPDDHIYVDGGLSYNYPITAFDGDIMNDKTLGFRFGVVVQNPQPSALTYGELLDYVKVVFDMLLDTQKIDYTKDHPEHKRSVNIDDFGISATNFELTDAQKKQLYDSGHQSTLNFIENYQDQVDPDMVATK